MLGNGTWLNVGGNQAVTAGGDPAKSQSGGSAPYYDPDGGKRCALPYSFLAHYLIVCYVVYGKSTEMAPVWYADGKM